MKIDNRCVSVDVRGTLNRSVRVPVNISCPDVSFAPVNDDIEEHPTSPENICFAFTVIEVSPPLEGSPQPCEITVTLKSELQETFLAVDLSDRRLILKDLEEAGERSQNHHFILRPDAQPIDREDTFIGIIPADQGMICHGNDTAEEVSLCLRLLGISRGNKAVEAAWIEQLAIFSVVEEDTESAEAFGIAGKSPKPASYLDNKRLLDKVEEMIGGELDEAKGFLGCQYNEGNLPKEVESAQMVKAAKLVAIMCECVYLRDLEFRHEVKKIMRQSKSIWETIRNWINGGSAEVSESLSRTIAQIYQRKDRALAKIQEVAEKMGLCYLPLANISEADRLNANGPCCGVFYSDSEKPFIVIVFKGTSTAPECITNLKYRMIAGNAISSLRGDFHSGFLNGLFTTVPIGLSTNKKRLRESIPINMITIQLNRLVQDLHGRFPGKKVQLWTSGHSLGGAYATVMWSAFLDMPRLRHSTLRDLITFGAPRVGNEIFASTIESIKERRNVWRFVNGKDIVASVPGNSPIAGVKYFHSGFPVRISAGEISLGSPETGPGPKTPRLNTSLAKVWRVMFWIITQNSGSLTGLDKFVTDHFLDSYWSALKSAPLPRGTWPLPAARGEDVTIGI